MHQDLIRKTYAEATWVGCQSSVPILSAKPSMPALCAAWISEAQSFWVYGYVFPTMWWATTSFGALSRLCDLRWWKGERNVGIASAKLDATSAIAIASLERMVYVWMNYALCGRVRRVEREREREWYKKNERSEERPTWGEREKERESEEGG